MNVIYKYRLQLDASFEVKAPPGEIRHIAEQPTTFEPGIGYVADQVCMWIEHHTDEAPIVRRFRLFATGEEFDTEGLEFVSTFFHRGGAYVWHVYEEVGAVPKIATPRSRLASV